MSVRFEITLFIYVVGLVASAPAWSDGIREIRIDDADRTERIKIPETRVQERNQDKPSRSKSDSQDDGGLVRIIIDEGTPCAEVPAIQAVNRESQCLHIEDSGALELKRTSPGFISFEKNGSQFIVTCASQAQGSQRTVYKYSLNDDGKLAQFTISERNLTFEYKNGKCTARIGLAPHPSATSTPQRILIPTTPDGAGR